MTRERACGSRAAMCSAAIFAAAAAAASGSGSAVAAACSGCEDSRSIAAAADIMASSAAVAAAEAGPAAGVASGAAAAEADRRCDRCGVCSGGRRAAAFAAGAAEPEVAAEASSAGAGLTDRLPRPRLTAGDSAAVVAAAAAARAAGRGCPGMKSTTLRSSLPESTPWEALGTWSLLQPRKDPDSGSNPDQRVHQTPQVAVHIISTWAVTHEALAIKLPHLAERAHRVPHALQSTGMLGGPLRQQGEEVMRHSGLVQGPSTRLRGPPLRAPVARAALPPAPGCRVRGMRQRLAGRAGGPASNPMPSTGN